MTKRRIESRFRRWLLLPPLLLLAIDTFLTQWFQPNAYWRGEFTTVNEFSPLWAFTMRSHPLLHIGATLAYVGIIVLLIRALPRRAAFIASLTVTLWHVIGSASWIMYRLPQGYWLTVAYAGIVAGILEWSYRKSECFR